MYILIIKLIKKKNTVYLGIDYHISKHSRSKWKKYKTKTVSFLFEKLAK